MKKTRIVLVLGGLLSLFTCVLLWCCARIEDDCCPPALKTLQAVGTRGQSNDNESFCTLPPETFKESDLIGTWYAGHSMRNDTLILREDGKYKQIINVQNPEYNYEYESDWRDWWVEDRGSGTPYLHLDRMHLCVYHIGRDCEVEGGGPGGWHDFCEKRSVVMPGEGILPVLGIQEGFVQPPRGIKLVPFVLDIPGSGFSYRLKE